MDLAQVHDVSIKSRKSIELTGVKKIESFDSLEFLIETALGYLTIQGSELTLARYDQEKGEVGIKGNIESLVYLANKKKMVQKDKMLGKLLK